MKRSRRSPLLLPLSLFLLSSPSFAQTAPPPATPAPAVEPPVPSAGPNPIISLTTLRILKDKGLITQAEYDSAVRDIGDSVGQKNAGESNTLVVGKWATTVYGYLQADSIWDSTQSFNDQAGGAQVARPGTYAGNNDRVQFGIRGSRLGFLIKAPELGGVRATALLEMDFLGNQNPIGPIAGTATTATAAPGATGSGTDTEQQYFTNPAVRIRHARLKIETPIVDLIFGQYWSLYGWQAVYAPNTVEIQGVPGQLNSRTPQIRISKSVNTDSFLFEIAVAALRPPQRDAAIPDGQAGIRIGTPAWSGLTTHGQTATAIEPLSIAVTGDARSFRVPPYNNPSGTPISPGPSKLGTSIAVDGFLPIIPAKKRQGNALSATGEFSTGYGNLDFYKRRRPGDELQRHDHDRR